MLIAHSTLSQFLIEERRRDPGSAGGLDALVLDVALACKSIARHVAYGALRRGLTEPGGQGSAVEAKRQLEALANATFLESTEWGGHLAGMVSGGMDEPYGIPPAHPQGGHLLVFDPLDGSANLDVNVSVGSLFSILRSPRPGERARVEDFLRPGTEQVCAGYAIYGPATMFVLSVGSGVHAFTLDPDLGDFILTHPSIQIPATTSEFAINASNSRFWAPAVRRYVEECLAGTTGPRGRDFSMRWIASLVAELHRILMRGGIFLYPQDSREPARGDRLRLLHECNPVSFLVEQAGGLATTGQQRVLEVAPQQLHQRAGLVFGSREEVERVRAYHRDVETPGYDSPLFGSRGLFRGPA